MGIKPDRKCVIVVDLQADFTEFKNGALKVPGTNEHYLRNVQDAVKRLRDSGFLLVATQDWHPPNHISFFTNHPGKKAFEEISIRERKQILWPPHCVQHTEGATLLLDPELFDSVVRKGQDPLYDSYSAFKDDGGHETGLHTFLTERSVDELIIFGLATDYCVMATVKDAISYGYKVHFIDELSRGVDPLTTQKATQEMKKLGVIIHKDTDRFTK